MDLIYANAAREDINVMKNYEFDLAFGDDENNFKLSTSTKNHVCLPGYYVYIEGTEYGGRVDGLGVKTKNGDLTYTGRTWHGILASKFFEPDPGEDYLICAGEANTVIGALLTRLGLSDLFTVSADDSEINISNYQMHRYINGYQGLRKMLKSANAKLRITFANGIATLSAVPVIDYSTNEEFDSSQIEFTIEKNYAFVNHMICLGQGELKNRQVVHLYADADGNISKEQTFTGLEEITQVYDNANCESAEELEQEGIEEMQEAWTADKADINFNSLRDYDVDDIVGARENITGIFIAKPIIKKIIKIKNNILTIQHKVGK